MNMKALGVLLAVFGTIAFLGCFALAIASIWNGDHRLLDTGVAAFIPSFFIAFVGIAMIGNKRR